jgi:hypothetical protein
MAENDRGLFVKLRILRDNTKPNNDIYLFNYTDNLEIPKDEDIIKIGSSQSKYEFQFLILK